VYYSHDEMDSHLLSKISKFSSSDKKSINFLLITVHFIFILLIINISYSQTLKKGPYLLFDDDNTRMEVLWQTVMTSTDTIRWGLDLDYSSGISEVAEFGPDHQHRIILTGLEPGKMYYYQVAAGGDLFSGSFNTAPPAGISSVQFFAYGDSRTGVNNHNRIAGEINDIWIDHAEYQTFILSMGDLVTKGDLESSWNSDLFNPGYPNIWLMMANLPLMACRGNHEESAALFGKYFPYPFIEKYYYSIDYGPAHIAFVDIYTPIKPGSEQYDWLVNDLSRSTSPWKFICLHTPAWSAAGGHANNPLVQGIIEPLCEALNVPILFAGHNHYYARAVVKESNGDSVIHITCGGGGAPLHNPQPGMENVITSSKKYHFCKIRIINDDLLQFEAISDSGTVIDHFVIDRGISTISSFQGDNTLSITPNPFNVSTMVEYTLGENALVQLLLFSLDGEVVKQLVPQVMQDRGNYKLLLEGSGLSEGIYICRLIVKNERGKSETLSRKVVVIK
jgi:hypothetical protein